MFVIGWAVGGVWIADDFETAWYCAQRGVQAFHDAGHVATEERPALWILDAWGPLNDRNELPYPVGPVRWGDPGPPPPIELRYPS